MGIEFLFDPAPALAVEVLDRHQLLGDFVQLLDPPAPEIEVAQVLSGICLAVEQRGPEDEEGFPGGVFHQAQAARRGRVAAMLEAQSPESVLAWCDTDNGFRLPAGDEGVERGVPLDPEHGMQAALRMGAEQLPGIVAAVVDHDIVFGQGLEMRERRLALVLMRVEVEVDGDFRPQLVQAAYQALRVMRHTRWRPVAFLDQRPRQVYLGAVHGEDPVPFPSLAGIGQAGLFENPAMENLEHVLVQLGPGIANRRGRNRLRLGQRDPQRPALVPQFGKCDRVALPVLREHQPEDEQHDQQGVQHPAAALP